MRKNSKTFLIAITAFIVFISCNDDSRTIEKNLDEFKSIAIPSTYQTSPNSGRSSEEDVDVEILPISFTLENGKVIEGSMRFTMPATDEGSLINFEISSNLIEESGLSTDFWSDYYKKTSNGRVASSSCTADCQKQYTDENGNKIKGRGGCKAECWVKAVAPIVAAAIGAAAAIITS